MKVLFQLNHPAHFHLFKHTIKYLQENGHSVLISIKDKDILENLVKNYNYFKISDGYRKKNIFSILKSLINRDKKLLQIVKNNQPDLLLGTSPEIGHISFITKIPSIFLGEDDVNLSISMYLGAISCYPLFNTILSPKGVNNSIWNKKTIFYNSYQKIAYLHPNYFKADRSKVDIPLNEKFFLIRFSNHLAYHDKIESGISNNLATQLIDLLKQKGHVLISSERKLPKEFEKYRFKGSIHDIHHYLFFTDLFIGDSQSMAVESAILGTPNIRFNSFIGKISILEEIEKKYKLSIGINSNNPFELINTTTKLINNPHTVNEFKANRINLLNDKINTANFLNWFIENYPESVNIMKSNPDYQYNFK